MSELNYAEELLAVVSTLLKDVKQPSLSLKASALKQEIEVLKKQKRLAEVASAR